MWIRKLAVIGGQVKEGDYSIFRRKQDVGRVHPAPEMPGIQPWEWSTKTHPCFSGRADSFDAALHQLREAIRARWPDDLPEVPRSGTRFRDLP